MPLFKKLSFVPRRGFHWFWQTSAIKKLLTLTIIGAVVWFGYNTFAVNKEPAPEYQTETVTKETIIETVSVSGSVTANSQTNIVSTTTGVIQEVSVKNGDHVTAGQNLFKVKSTATPQEQATAYTNYQSAVNAFNSAQQTKLNLQATLEKSRKVVLDAQQAVDDKNADLSDYSQLEKDSIDSDLTSARQTFTADEKKYLDQDGAIAAAAANVTATSIEYQETQDSIITAPIAGTVANFSAGIGSAVTASASNANSSSNATATTVLVLGDFSGLSVTATVNEVDIAKIKPGQKATITIDAFTDKTFVGTVASVDTIGTNSSGVVTYNVYINFVTAPKDVYAGMTASALIQTAIANDVLSVPNSAIVSSNGESMLRVLRNGQLSLIPVETGIASDTNTEIVSGISEGDTVITGMSSPAIGTSGSQTTSPFSTFGGRSSGGVSKGGGGGAPVMMLR